MVLSQSFPRKEALAAIQKQCQLLYTSPAGVKVWSGGPVGRLATHLLSRARGFHRLFPPRRIAAAICWRLPEGRFLGWP